MLRARTLLIVTALAAAIGISGCGAGSADDEGVVRVVASTNVYGDLVSSIGGELVDVTSVIDDPAKDPHEYEADARTQLALSRADLVVRNGGGYDDFIDTLLDASGNADVAVVDAVELSGFDVSATDFNEHVWYDYATVMTVGDAIANGLGAVDPANRAIYADNLALLLEGIAGLQNRAQALAELHAGTPVAITEPVPLYLLEALGLQNRTPAAFSEAVEEDTDVSPAVLRETLALFSEGTVAVLVYNPQTGGPQTEDVLDAADTAGVPAVPADELLPEGLDYVEWQNGLIDAIEAALE